MNKMYTRQGYLYAQNGRNGSMKALGGSGWTKYYCQYVAKTKTLTMIPYNQTTGKITSTETIRVGECAFKEKEDAGNKSTTTTTANAGGADKFKFVVTGEDMGEGVAGVSFGIQERGSSVCVVRTANKCCRVSLRIMCAVRFPDPYAAGTNFPLRPKK